MDSSLDYCSGISTAIVFCLGLAPVYSIFVVSSEGNFKVVEFPKFSSGVIPRDYGLKCLQCDMITLQKMAIRARRKAYPS